MNQRPLRIGIAGLGTVSNTVLPELRDHPNVTIAAAADVRPEAGERFTALYGGEAFTSVEDLCASPNIDAVYVLTPNHWHAAHAIMAAEHGKQVIVTKPIATTLEDCDAMIAAAERHGVRLMAGTTPAFTPIVMEMARIVASGELGKLLFLNTWWQTDWLYLPRMPDELDVAKGGGVVFRQAPHQIDIVRTIGGGMVRSVRASASRGDSSRPVEGGYMAFLEFESGAVATMTYSGYAHLDSTELTYGTDASGMPRSPQKHLETRRRA
ncbi:MAG: Gfo/Idh/MocA family oxidoreductase, partial [Chloroflexota bacterium]